MEACNGEFLNVARPVENAGFATNPVDLPEWLPVLEENSPGNVRSEMPILLIQGSEDLVVRQRYSDALFERLCATGSMTDYRVIEGSGHAAFREVLPAVLEWTNARFAGEAAVDGCPPP
jgi:alpha-beta hydrolase superfamily lysophospholipase